MYKQFFLVVSLATLFSSCGHNKNSQEMQQGLIQPLSQHVFEVSEVIQGNTYTYLLVKENMMDHWVAIGKKEVAKGEIYYYDKALQMTNFHSKEIDRTFDVIYFVNQISKTPLNQQQRSMSGGMQVHSGKVAAIDAEVQMNKKEGELSIAEVYKSKAYYSSNEFEIRGIVIKVNKQVMGKNWVHIQDGTSNEDNFDLTITTQADVKKGDEVIFKGKLSLDKNFGAGYFYNVIMEDGTLISNTKL